MPQTAPLHNLAHITEVNFVVVKFMEWPDGVRRRIYKDITGSDGEAIAQSSYELLELLTADDNGELARYANSILGTDLSGYFVWDDQKNLTSRAIWLYRHFAANLKLDGDRVYINPIPYPGR